MWHLALGSAICMALGLAAGLESALSAEPAEAIATEDVPPGVEILLPRGAIAAVFEPQWVTAEEADIPDEAWVLGIAVDNEAHAYSLNLLNRHEIVNDRFGDLPVAAVW